MPVSAIHGQVHQDFDNPGSPYLLCSHQPLGALAALRHDAPPQDFSGRYLRLASIPALPVANHNSVIFDTWDPGPVCRQDVMVEFDLRMTPEDPLTSRADGLGLALLRASNYASDECVAPEGPLYAAEEPNFQGSLGFGFDIYHSARPFPEPLHPDRSANHISIHYAGEERGQFELLGLDLARADWIHVRIRIHADAQGGRVSIVLKPRNIDAAPVVAVEDFLVKGFAPYPWRLWIGARSGDQSANHDVDNIHVTTSGCASLDGQWDGTVLAFPVVPIHAHLLPTGKVMFWDRHDHPPFDQVPRLWDPAAPGVFTSTPDPGYGLFCSGHAFDADGGLFISGGHIEDHDGEPKASTYNPFNPADPWIHHPNMNAGRWYPTSTTLADGQLLTVSGDYFDALGNTLPNTLPQVLEPGPDVFHDLKEAERALPLYPFMFLAPNGKVFNAGPEPATRYLDTTGDGAWSFVALSSYGRRSYGSAVMYQPGNAMILGGSPQDASEPPTNSVEVIDLSVPWPHWDPLAHMAYARRQANATLLADGSVLVTGGSSARGLGNALGAVLSPELWNPGTGAWRTLAPMQEARLYHSTALLLPDARVLVAGGGHPRDVDNGDPDHFSAEIFSPPYLFQSQPRPRISAVPEGSLSYGETFLVATLDAAKITDVTWVRLGSVTHGFNQNQRFNRLRFQQVPDGLLVDAPADGKVAPPGHYMLFILSDGVPSVARILRIG